MAEWFKAAVLKTAVGSRLPWVRIPPCPPLLRPVFEPREALMRVPILVLLALLTLWPGGAAAQRAAEGVNAEAKWPAPPLVPLSKWESVGVGAIVETFRSQFPFQRHGN